jgi:hypothetical protein
MTDIENLKSLKLNDLEKSNKKDLQKAKDIAEQEIDEWKAFVNLIDMYLRRK